jgi:hypothetical protein
MTPNVFVQVDLVGAAARVDDDGNTLANFAEASGIRFRGNQVEHRTLSATFEREGATPRDTVLEPGAETLVDVEVKDASGRSVAGTDTAVIVVDESVLALTSYKLADPSVSSIRNAMKM